MTYLLDTHYLLWALTDTKKLPGKAKEVIVNPENRIIISTVSLWEISLKNSLGKLTLTGFSPADLPDACGQVGFEIKSLTAEESSTYHQLKANYHKDPFDRMLIWQAMRNDYIFVSADKEVKKYASDGLKIFITRP
jgi:PIN domain nuclease of toxin-antitoxin system